MSFDLLEQAARVLGDLVDEVVFVGGATLEAYVTESGAIPFRGTIDVDVVIAAVSRPQYERFAERLRARGVSEDSSSDVICRFRHASSGLMLDVMGRSADVFGFTNPWYDSVFETAEEIVLPSGSSIRIGSAPALLATKVAAFLDRGRAHPLASHDLDDIVRLVDSRPELADELAAAEASLSHWVRAQLSDFLRDRIMLDALRGQMPGDAHSQRRFDDIILPRLERMVRGESSAPVG